MTTIHSALKLALVAFTAAALPSAAWSAGLGPIKVHSGLGQNLRAEIEVSATPAELQSLSARIASLDAFRQAGVPYSATAARIDLRLDPNPQRPLLRLSSSRPIDDPYVGLLVEIDWATGNLAREYTFLLDPVELAPTPAPTAESAPASAPAPVTAAAPAVAPPAARPAAVRTAPPAAPTAAEAAPRTYLVRRGDTLHRIASNNLPRGVTLDQMLIALHRANRAAFEADNINLLHTGAVLVLPDSAQASAVGAGEARRAVRAQAADFQAYRRSLAAAAARTPARSAAAGQLSSGRIVPRVEEAAPAAETADRVQVSRSREALPAQADVRLQALEEELAARERALEDSNERLGQLEQAVRDLQKLLELRGNLAGVPAQPVVEGEGEAATAAQPAAVAEAPAPHPAEEPPAPEPVSAPTPAPAVEPVPAPAATEEAGLLQKLIAQPLLAAGVGGIAALLLLGLGFLLGRAGRRTETVVVPAADSTKEQETLYAHTGEQEVDTGGSLSLGSSQAGMSSISDEDGVDPVAEADVYMAYGRDAQAEEILRDALAVDPSRAAIYLKLLEIHAQRGEVAPFEQVARPLHQLTDGAGWDWEKAAAMGRKLDPGNPLYAEGSAESHTLAPRTVVPAAMTAAAAGLANAAAAEPTVAPIADEPAPREELVHTLSDLDFTSSRIEQPAPDTTTAAADTADDLLDFDLDEIDLELGGDEDLGAAETGVLATAQPQASGFVSEDGSANVDLELDPEPSDTPTQPPSAPLAASAPASELSRMAAEFDFDLPELELDAQPDEFDLSTTVVGATPPAAEPVASAATETSAEQIADKPPTAASAELLDFDFELDSAAPLTMAPPAAATAPAAAPAAAPTLAGGVDLSGITLDLEPLEDAPTPVKAAQARAAAAGMATNPPTMAPASALESTMIEPIEQAARDAADALGDVSEELETKLELARAYEDMGDREGALELIEEVLRSGSATQQLAAREMQQRLG